VSSAAQPGTPAASDPRGFPGVVLLGALWALVLIGLGVLAGHDALVYAGALSGPAWVEQALGSADGESATYWAVVVGVAAVLVGLALLAAAIRPRSYLGRAVNASTGVFLLDRGLRNLATTAAEDVDGVDWARASHRGRTLRVDVRGLGVEEDEQLESRVRTAVEERFSALRTPPAVQVRDVGRG